MKAQTLIAVADVPRASAWYQTLLNCRSLHGGTEYDQLAMPDEDDFFMQLHAWAVHDHPNISDANAGLHGHGVLLWFKVDDFQQSLNRIREINAKIVVDPHVNERAFQNEVWITDLDGYTVVIACHIRDTIRP